MNTTITCPTWCTTDHTEVADFLTGETQSFHEALVAKGDGWSVTVRIDEDRKVDVYVPDWDLAPTEADRLAAALTEASRLLNECPS